MKIADMHCDTISKIWESQKKGIPQQLSKNNMHVDIQKMKQSGYLVQNFAMYIDLKKELDPFEYVSELIEVFYDELRKNEKDICAVKTYDEILENEKQGKISALMTIEEGGCCKGDIKNLEKLYELGARMMTLTWNYPNELAGANGDNSSGLTKKGFAFIERMEELGMIIDVSHLSDAGFWDVASNTKKPFVASHSNARTLCSHVRNLTDEMIRTIADRGGVIGLNFYGHFLDEAKDYYSSVSKIAEHARHIIRVGGIECLGLGSDFDGIDGELEMQDCSQLHMLADELKRQHLTTSQIEKIFYQNVMRIYKEML